MPIYEYKCRDCRKNFEIINTSINNRQPVKCPACDSPNTSKTISAGSYKISSGSSSVPAGALSGCSSGSGFS